MYSPVTNKVVVSRDVVFAEYENWKWCKDELNVKESVLNWSDNEGIEAKNGEEISEGI